MGRHASTALSVHKFGGTSLGDAERILRAADLLAPPRAAGRSSPSPRRWEASRTSSSRRRATPRGGASPRRREAVETLRARHEEAARALSKATGARVSFDARAPRASSQTALSGVALLRERSPRVTDLIASFGERLSAPLVAAALAARGVPAVAVDARRMLVTDERHGAATCDRKRSDPRVRRLLGPLLKRGVVPVVTGFIARSAARRDDDARPLRLGHDGRASRRRAPRAGGRHLDRRGRRPLGRPADRPRARGSSRASRTARRRR